MTNEIAVLIAAGKGVRMLPLTATTPKPLISVHGKPMIETIIEGLNGRGISHIYVTVGYLKEQFKYLEDKYTNLTLVENTEYEVKNNISSIYAVKDIINGFDCFVCEADLYVYDPSIFLKTLDKSCYYGKFIPGYSDDWVFDMNKDRIVRVGKYGSNTYNMCGISYLKKDDMGKILKAVEEAYKDKSHEQMFWDEIVNQELDNIYLTISPVERHQITEIDTVEELAAIDNRYEGVVRES